MCIRDRGQTRLPCEFVANLFSGSRDISCTNKKTRAKDVLPNINRTQAATQITLRPRCLLSVHSRHPRQRWNGPVCCWMTLFAASALQCIFNLEEICPWWPWPLTLTFKLVRARDKHVFRLNLGKICSADPEIFHMQTKKVTDSAKNRILCSSLRAVMNEGTITTTTTTTTTRPSTSTILRALYRATCISRHPLPPVKNSRILLKQSFTARMPLLMATSAFGLGEDATVLLNSVSCTVYILPWRKEGVNKYNKSISKWLSGWVNELINKYLSINQSITSTCQWVNQFINQSGNQSVSKCITK